MSSNVAEFTGAIAAVEEASKLDREIILRGSNTMIINQLAGKWKVRSPKALYVPYYEKAMLLVHSRRSHISFKLISPALNEECELISKKVLYEKGVVLIDSDGWRFDGEIYMPPTS
jgi:ribonuclease HI